MPTQTRIIQPRNVKVGDRIATTNGMREVLKVEHLRHPRLPHHATKLNPYRPINARLNRVYRVDITVQDVMSEAGTVLTFMVDRPTKVTVQREGKARKTETREQLAEWLIGEVNVEVAEEDAQEHQDRAVFINHYCFESGATREDALAAWAKRKAAKLAEAQIHCEVCGGNHVEEYHTPANV